MTQTAASQADMTPAASLEALIDGNRRFLEGRGNASDLREQVEATKGGQWPFAAIVTCIDSRTAPELVFDQGIGDLFSVRIAGNFVNDDMLGSLEFACRVAGAKLVVVMGHTHCGAIKGACDGVELGHLTGMLTRLRPAVDETKQPADPAQRTSGNADFVQEVARRNVALTVTAIRERSEVLRQLEEAGTIRIVGAMYDVETGAVDFTT